jgi:hypothetical protein
MLYNPKDFEDYLKFTQNELTKELFKELIKGGNTLFFIAGIFLEGILFILGILIDKFFLHMLILICPIILTIGLVLDVLKEDSKSEGKIIAFTITSEVLESLKLIDWLIILHSLNEVYEMKKRIRSYKRNEKLNKIEKRFMNFISEDYTFEMFLNEYFLKD